MKRSEFIPGRKHAPETIGAVLVLGLGKSGRAAADYLVDRAAERVERLHVAGGAATDEARAFVDGLAQRADAAGIPFSVAFDTEEIPDTFDLCIASPGIPPHSALRRNAQAASTELISEIEFAWRESAADSTWLAVTGTNGKTTTTALAAHILKSCGYRAQAVGNIGDVALRAVAAGGPDDVYVVEVSSYQLDGTRLFAPDAAVILNITPDHLSWHGGFEEYKQAKYRVLANLAGTAVLDATDAVLRGKIAELADAAPDAGTAPDAGAAPDAGTAPDAGETAAEGAFAPAGAVPPIIAIGSEAGIGTRYPEACGVSGAAWLDGGILRVEMSGIPAELCAATDLRILGEHNVSNALAAAAAALSLGAPAAGVARALTTFAPLPHRIEPVGTVRGVECYNDSKGTNVDATLKALAAFPAGTAVLLLGGRDKGTDLGPLTQAASQQCKGVVCFGEARARFLAAFAADAPDLPCVEAAAMEAALDAGLALAAPGDAVVLSPACASFDEFSCYQERGDVFRRAVAQRAADVPAPPVPAPPVPATEAGE